MSWHGPYRIRRLIEQAINEDRDWPSEDAGAYVITLREWSREPSAESKVLYVGGNTGKSNRFRTRIGDLIADMLGFYGSETGHHSGGQSLHKWCRAHRINPLDLHIAWRNDVQCKRCAEIELYNALAPTELNRVRPSACPEHG